MGGKTATQTSQVTIPPAVLARYNAVNAQAQQVAQTPFQQYSTDPNAFVAPVNDQQNQAIAGINTAANQAQQYFGQATSTLQDAQASAQPYYGASGSDITGAQGVGTGLAGASLSSLQGANASAAPLQAAANSNYNAAYQNAQPYQAGATGLALAGAQQVNPNQLNIGEYLSPYLQTVLGSEANVLNQNNQQQQAGQLGNAITSGAFGGDRAGIAAANLEEQQNLANSNIYSNILNQGFNTALGAAQQQQGVALGAGQANRAAVQNAAGQIQSIGQQGYEQGLGLGQAQQGLGQQVFGQGATTAGQEAALGQQQFGQGLAAAGQQAQLGQDVYGTGAATSAAEANLGTGAQAAAEQGAQAQLQAGTLQQQTTQAGDTALYNQFLQQQSYPFQVAQFLANIAEGTGALSGSTTTTTQPGSILSDERAKEDIRSIGKTYDGQNIVSFRYKGDNKKQIGLIAQDVEKKHPDAVGLAGGLKTVNYEKATEDAADRGHFRAGGLARAALAYGGAPLPPGISPYELAALVQAQGQMYAPFGQAGLYGGPGGGAPRGGSSYVPQANLPVYRNLMVANAPYRPQQDNLQTANEIANLASNKSVNAGLNQLMGLVHKSPGSVSGVNDNFANDTSAGLPGWTGTDDVADSLMGSGMKRGGLAGGRRHYDDGGDVLPYEDGSQGDYSPIGPHLTIPNQSSHPQLATAQNPHPQAQQSPVSQIGGLAQGLGSAASGIGALLGGGATEAGLGAGAAGAGLMGATAAGGAAAGGFSLASLLPLLAMFKDGGRVGYAQGGSPDDGDLADQDLHQTLLKLVRGDPDAPPDQNTPPDAQGAPPAAFSPPGVGLAAGAPSVAQAPQTALAQANPVATHLPSGVAAVLPLIAAAEGTHQNASSSAVGPYGLINSSFVTGFRNLFPGRAQGMSDGQITALRHTPEGSQLSQQIAPWLLNQNVQVLQKAGFEPTAGNAYLSWFLGAPKAVQFLKADPSTPVSQIASQAAIDANPTIMKDAQGRPQTVGHVTQWITNRMAQMQAMLAKKQGLAAGGRAGFADGGDPDVDMSFADTLPKDAQPPPPANDPGQPDQGGQGLGAGSFTPIQQGQADTAQPPNQKKGWQGIVQSLENPNVFIPLLTGAAAAAATPTRNPLSALAVGAGAAGQAYQAQRAFEQQQQQLSQHGAEVNVMQQTIPLRQQEIQNQLLQIKASLLPLAQAQMDKQYQRMPGRFDPTDGSQMYMDLGNPSGQPINQRQYNEIYNQRLNAIGSMMTQGSGAAGAGAGLASILGDNGNVGVPGAVAPAPNGQPPAAGGPPAVNVQPAVGAGPVGAGAGQPAGVGTQHAAPRPQVASAKAPALPSGHEAPGTPAGPPPMPGDSEMLAATNSGAFRLKNTLAPPQAPDNATGFSPTDPQSPLYLQNVIAHSTDPAAVQAAREQLGRYTNGVDLPQNVNGQPDPRYRNYQASLTAYNAQVGTAGQKRDQFGATQAAVPNAYQTQRQILDSFSQALQANSAGAMTESLSEAAKRLYPLMPPGQAKDKMQQFSTGIDVADKDAARLAIAQAIASGMSSGTGGATLLDFSHAANPHVGQTPGAQWQLLTQAYAMQDRALHEAQDFNAQKGLGVEDTDAWNTKWQQTHPYQEFQGQAQNYTPFFAGMSDAEKRQFPRTVPNGIDPRALPSVRSGDYFRDPRTGQLRRVP